MTTVYTLDGKFYCRQHAPSGATSSRLKEGDSITCQKCEERMIGEAPSGPHTCHKCGKVLTPTDDLDICQACRGKEIRGLREQAQRPEPER